MRPPRLVTATSLFDGHDAAIHIVRRMLMARGAEVVHLGHDRSVDEIVHAAIQEDADAIAVSSYQGGHMEFFRYLVDELRARGGGDVQVFGGGGGTILPEEAAALEAYGVARIFGPEDGMSRGLGGMIDDLLQRCKVRSIDVHSLPIAQLAPDQHRAIARCISWLETCGRDATGQRSELVAALECRTEGRRAPVVGITGTGGAGKSSFVDEMVRRLRRDLPDVAIGLLLVDPTRRRSGGALLGDRIRMNAIDGQRIYVRSLATRGAHRSLSEALQDALRVLQAAQFDLVVVETAGIGQSDSQIVDCTDLSIYLMTSEYGAPSQLEKIDMLELADLVVLNKFDRPGSEDALRDVRKQWKRNHLAFDRDDADLPVVACTARAYRDPGCDRAYFEVRKQLASRELFPAPPDAALPALTSPGAAPTGNEPEPTSASQPRALIPPHRHRYLAEIAEAVRAYHAETRTVAALSEAASALYRTLQDLGDAPPAYAPYPDQALEDPSISETVRTLRQRYNRLLGELGDEALKALREFEALLARHEADTQGYRVRDQEISVDNYTETLSNTRVPKVALPHSRDWATRLQYMRDENVPGTFPYTAGVFPFRRQNEDPTRMFAGEGHPERTNRRFHLLARGARGVRLSTAFDSVTLYGRDPDERPDIYGKVGNAGVSVCTVDDAKKLYSGFDLCDPATSVSMTINGPAPIVLAFFLNAAIDQQVERHLRAEGKLERVRRQFVDRRLPSYHGPLPDGHDGFGLGLLGIPGDDAVDAETYARIRNEVLSRVRGTVQADILKEDQAQNTCIFATDFALHLMGDIQEFFCREGVRNFYSVSISGYHIAEAGANPITQLAFTLANAFTYCEYYLARGMPIDAFAPNLSFFFSHGLDAEYQVLGRVARRIWAIAMRHRYGADARSQKLKYHIQTSGRSLHAQEMAFNDIRTTLQAASALWDNCNSLHTNAYDEAVTTPTEQSVRRAMAIQLIVQRELGLYANENPLQGAYIIDDLTERVEAAVLAELERLSERGGVLGAMELLYQRAKIQEESLHYEALKHTGKLPIIGVNTFMGPTDEASARPAQVMRSTEDEKRAQLEALRSFHARWQDRAAPALAHLQACAHRGENLFDALMNTVKFASLGQITGALFDVGGRYRRAL